MEQTRALPALFAALRGLLKPPAADRTAYAAGFSAGPGRQCPYRDQASIDAWHAGRDAHDEVCDQAW